MSSPTQTLDGVGTRVPHKSLSVMISWDGKKITQIAIAGRPDHPFARGEGNHTTAWAVYGDTVRRRIVGRSVRDAENTITELIRGLNAKTDKDLLPAKRAAAFMEACTTAEKAIPDDVKNRSGTVPLQQAIHWYLVARNLAPFAGVFLGAAQAIGAGERKPLSILRSFEETAAQAIKDDEAARAVAREEAEAEAADEDEDNNNDTSGIAPGRPPVSVEVATAIWALMDARTVDYLGQVTEIDNVPGLAGLASGDQRAAAREIVRRHLAEIEKAYPRAFTYAENAGDGLKAHAPLAIKKYVSSALSVPAAVDVAAEGWSGWGNGVAVSFSLGGTGRKTISEVHVGQRGRTILGGQGSHLTAHVVFVRSIVHALDGNDLKPATNNLLLLVGKLAKLPTFPTPATVDGKPSLDPKVDPAGVFDSAWVALLDAQRTMTNAKPDAPDLPEMLQELATCYLRVRNGLPYVAMMGGKIPNGRNESRAVAILDAREQARSQAASVICGAMWALLDIDSLGDLLREKKETGVVSDPVMRTALIIEAHAQSVAAAWPGCFVSSNLRSAKSLTYVLERLDSLEGTKVAQALDALKCGWADVEGVKPTFPHDKSAVVQDETVKGTAKAMHDAETQEGVGRNLPRRGDHKTERFGDMVSSSQIDSQVSSQDSEDSQPSSMEIDSEGKRGQSNKRPRDKT